MADSAWPLRTGYIHPDARLRFAIDVQAEHTGHIIPLDPRQLAEFLSRDVGIATDEPFAEVYTDPVERTVTMLTDERTAAVGIYAVRLLAFQYEAHARELRLVAERFPIGSYGFHNRLDAATRHERIAARGRVLERAYHVAVDKEYYGI